MTGVSQSCDFCLPWTDDQHFINLLGLFLSRDSKRFEIEAPITYCVSAKHRKNRPVSSSEA